MKTKTINHVLNKKDITNLPMIMDKFVNGNFECFVSKLRDLVDADFDTIDYKKIHEENIQSLFLTPNEQRDKRTVTSTTTQDHINRLLNGVFDSRFVVVINKDKAYLVEGGHRTRFLLAFYTGQTKFEYKGNPNCTFADLPKSIRNQILDRSICLEVYNNVEIDEIFTYYNSGNHVNRMEILHAQYCDSRTWKLSEEMNKDSVFASFLNNAKNEGYKNNNTALQCLALPAQYLMYKGTKMEICTKAQAVDYAFLSSNKNGTADIITSRLKYKVLDLIHLFNQYNVLSAIERSIATTGNRSHLRQNITNACFAFFKLTTEKCGACTNAETFRAKAEEIISRPDFCANLMKALKDADYSQYFANGKSLKQCTVLYDVIASI